MRRRDKNQFRRLFWILFRNNAIGIHRHGMNIQPVNAQGIAHAPVSGVFNPDLIANITQGTRHQINGLVNAFGNNNLVGIALH